MNKRTIFVMDYVQIVQIHILIQIRTWLSQFIVIESSTDKLKEINEMIKVQEVIA